MYHYTLIQTSVYLQQKKAAQNGRCLSSVHHPFIDQRCPFRKADAKVDTFFTSTKYFTNFFFKKNYSIFIYRKESLLVMPLNQGND